jgi:hypothetical protein
MNRGGNYGAFEFVLAEFNDKYFLIIVFFFKTDQISQLKYIHQTFTSGFQALWPPLNKL